MIKVMENKKLSPIHPGEILRTEFLELLNLSVSQLAQNLKVEEHIISDLLVGRGKMTPDLAYRLSCYFQVSSELFLNLQQRYDLKILDQE
jgi:antitoxin HigA-1